MKKFLVVLLVVLFAASFCEAQTLRRAPLVTGQTDTLLFGQGSKDIDTSKAIIYDIRDLYYGSDSVSYVTVHFLIDTGGGHLDSLPWLKAEWAPVYYSSPISHMSISELDTAGVWRAFQFGAGSDTLAVSGATYPYDGFNAGRWASAYVNRCVARVPYSRRFAVRVYMDTTGMGWAGNDRPGTGWVRVYPYVLAPLHRAPRR